MNTLVGQRGSRTQIRFLKTLDKTLKSTIADLNDINA